MTSRSLSPSTGKKKNRERGRGRGGGKTSDPKIREESPQIGVGVSAGIFWDHAEIFPQGAGPGVLGGQGCCNSKGFPGSEDAWWGSSTDRGYPSECGFIPRVGDLGGFSLFFPVSREFSLPVQAGKALENGNFRKLLPGFIGTIPGVALGRDGKGEVWDEGKSSNSLKIQQD